jgi:hypothetical protein
MNESYEFDKLHVLEELDLTLDEEWIKDAMNEEKSYSRFYKSPVQKIVCYSLFVDLSQNLIKLNRQYLQTNNNGILENSIVMNLISNDTKDEFKKFRILHVLNFNLDIEPADINKFIDNYDFTSIKKTYLKELSYTSDIIFKDTIHYLHPINSLILIYKEKISSLKNKNKNKLNQNNNKSKKIFNFTNNKTRKR